MVNIEIYGFTFIGESDGDRYFILREEVGLDTPNIEIRADGDNVTIYKVFPEDKKTFEKNGKSISIIPPRTVFDGIIEENWELEFILKRTCLDLWDDSIIEKIYHDTENN